LNHLIGQSAMEGRIKEILGSAGWNGQKYQWVDPTDPTHHISLAELDGPDAETKAQGKERDLICIDEAAQIAEKNVRYVTGWLRSSKPGQRKRVVFCSNPPLNSDGVWMLDWFGPWIDKTHQYFGQVSFGELLYACRSDRDNLVWFPPSYNFERDDDGKVKPIVLLDDIGSEWRFANEIETQRLNRAELPPAGELIAIYPESYTFIPAKISNNKAMADPAKYFSKLNSLPPDMKRKLLHGDFLGAREDSPNQMFPTAWVEDAMERGAALANNPMRRQGEQVVIGADVAQGGADNSVLASLHVEYSERDAPAWSIAPLLVQAGSHTPDGPAMVSFISMHRQSACLVAVDKSGGWGGSTIDILKAQRVPVQAWVASHKSIAKDKSGYHGFDNLRSEAFWRLRELLDPNGREILALPPDPMLKKELTAIMFELNNDKYEIESKDDIKKRLGHSPDRADAVVIACYYRSQGLNLSRQSVNNSVSGNRCVVRDFQDDW
jgi:hypothetical protein